MGMVTMRALFWSNKPNPATWIVFNEEQEKWFLVFRYSGSTFESLDRGAPVGIGLAIAHYDSTLHYNRFLSLGLP
jgi:hypothetical protein